MTPKTPPTPGDLPLWAVLCFALAVTLLLWLFDQPAEGAVPGPAEIALTDDQVAAVITCQVRTQRPHVVARRTARYYNPDQVAIYARAVRTGLEEQAWPAGLTWRDYVPVMLATVYQQSRWKHDAVSEWNTDGQGNRIIVHPETAWRRPNYDLDYGLGQVHWGWAYKRVESVTDLRDPATNLEVLGWWFARRADKCVRHYERKRCPRGAVVGDKTCNRRRKCLLTRQTFGVPGFAGTTDNLVRTFAPMTWTCIRQVLEAEEQT